VSRVLFAWQLGANYGHLTTDLAVARALRNAGHDVNFAVCDPHVAREVLLPDGFDFVPTPVPAPVSSRKSPVSYAEILLAAGFDDPRTASRLVGSWRELLELARPQVVVADHAPMAVVAARILAIPVVLFGTGFTIPPPLLLLPSIRPWEEVPLDRLRRADDQLLDALNRVLAAHGAAPLDAVRDLFSGHPQLLTTLAEIDHYAPRAGAQYLGPIAADPPGAMVSWQDTTRPRVFAYLRASVPRIDAVLMALEDSGAQVVCVMPDANAALVAHFRETRVAVRTERVQIAPILSSADLVVSYGGHGLVMASLLAGVPLLLVPESVEQYLGALKVQQLGAGLCVDVRGATPVEPVLQQLLASGSYRGAARQFAARYSSLDPAESIKRTTEVVAALAAGR